MSDCLRILARHEPASGPTSLPYARDDLKRQLRTCGPPRWGGRVQPVVATSPAGRLPTRAAAARVRLRCISAVASRWPRRQVWKDGPVTELPDREPARRLRPAILLSTTEDACTVFAGGRKETVAYARAVPTPRTERVAPGHLLAVAVTAAVSNVVVWRWFDAVVLEGVDGAIRLWEPAHGTVLAQPRDPKLIYRPGSRAYRSAGLPGAEWWVAGPAVDSAEDADVNSTKSNSSLPALGCGSGSPDVANPPRRGRTLRLRCAAAPRKRH